MKSSYLTIFHAIPLEYLQH